MTYHVFRLRNTSETAGLRVGHVCKYAPLPFALVSCVLHQNLLRDRQHLREPAHCDISCREPARPCAFLQNLGRLLQIDRDSVIGHVCKYTPSTSHSDLRLTEFLLREEVAVSTRVILSVAANEKAPPRLSSLSVAKDQSRR